MLQEGKKIRPLQRITTRKDQVRRALAKSPQLFQQSLPLGSGQLIRVSFSVRLRPAVATGKVAGPGGFPVNENGRLGIDQTAWPTSAYPMLSIMRSDHACHLASPFLVPTPSPVDDITNLLRKTNLIELLPDSRDCLLLLTQAVLELLGNREVLFVNPGSQLLFFMLIELPEKFFMLFRGQS